MPAPSGKRTNWETSPVSMPGPRLNEHTRTLLPEHLSATSYEVHLSAFSIVLCAAGLAVQDGRAGRRVDRSDYGTWLHEVIHQFHLGTKQLRC